MSAHETTVADGTEAAGEGDGALVAGDVKAGAVDVYVTSLLAWASADGVPEMVVMLG